MKSFLKGLAAHLPKRTQQRLKRRYFSGQIRRRRFTTDEPEFALLADVVKPGDWVIDVGANIGHYTLRLSELVGPSGRVLAFEPVLETFELLTANAVAANATNVTLINAAASSGTAVLGMEIPKFDSGLDNLYQAQLTPAAGGQFKVMCMAIDALAIPERVALVKIDAEGHDLVVLDGMRSILERDHPLLIVERSEHELRGTADAFGYLIARIPDSSNSILHTGELSGVDSAR